MTLTGTFLGVRQRVWMPVTSVVTSASTAFAAHRGRIYLLLPRQDIIKGVERKLLPECDGGFLLLGRP